MNAEDLTKAEQQGYRLAIAWLELGERPQRIRQAISDTNNMTYRPVIFWRGIARDDGTSPWLRRIAAQCAGCELAIQEWEARQ
jgi:hypothetical protein